jgi:hypothetical protein
MIQPPEPIGEPSELKVTCLYGKSATGYSTPRGFSFCVGGGPHHLFLEEVQIILSELLLHGER